jgi:hypothetical protein
MSLVGQHIKIDHTGSSKLIMLALQKKLLVLLGRASRLTSKSPAQIYQGQLQTVHAPRPDDPHSAPGT